MTNRDTGGWRDFLDGIGPAPEIPLPQDDFARASLEKHKHEGMLLAVRARWVALGIIAVMLPFLNPQIAVLYYHVILLAFALNGWAQMQVARVGRSRAEVALLMIDLILMTIAIMVPNPFNPEDWPLGMQFRFQTHQYFYIFLAFGTLAYTWRTVRGYGTMAALWWGVGLLVVWLMTPTEEPLYEAIQAALGGYPVTAELLNPHDLRWDLRVQEVVVFFIVAMILSITVRRFNDLLLGHAALERERTNLARYFSPNVVEELSHNDEPLKQIRTQNVAVLFVDIVGFTKYSADKSPEQVIVTLREFHSRMEAEVFRHHGTLDKFLGDGLMATFGTPVAGDLDACNALSCAEAMAETIRIWNAERSAAGEEVIRASFGVHYGPTVLGDVGGESRLEFAVIGNTVNVASRVEALTRPLNLEIAVTDELAQRAIEETGNKRLLDGFESFDDCEIRGVEGRMKLWGRPLQA